MLYIESRNNIQDNYHCIEIFIEKMEWKINKNENSNLDENIGHSFMYARITLGFTCFSIMYIANKYCIFNVLCANFYSIYKERICGSWRRTMLTYSTFNPRTYIHTYIALYTCGIASQKVKFTTGHRCSIVSVLASQSWCFGQDLVACVELYNIDTKS